MNKLSKERLSNIPILDLGEIYLRAIELSDYKDMFEYGSDEEVTKMLTWNTFKTEEEVTQVINNVFMTRPANGIPSAYVIVLKDENKMIGTCDFSKINHDKSEGEIGYALNRTYWGRGYMTISCKALIDFGFDYLGLKRINIRHLKENIGSQRVIEKCGFEFINETYDEKNNIFLLNYKMERK